MLTIEDLRNPELKSGFEHVNFKKQGKRDGPGWKPYQAEAGSKPHYVGEKTNAWRSPRRLTSEEAAQDYCDYMNGRNVKSIEDIRNPNVKSGFNFVNSANAGKNGHGQTTDMWRAEGPSGTADTARGRWRGPTRTDPIIAAQDYVDYVQGLGVAASVSLKSAGHKVIRGPRNQHPKRIEAKQLMREAEADEGTDNSGYVYCLLETETGQRYVKIGKSKGHPSTRLAGCQTGNPRVLLLVGYYKTENRHREESRLHAKAIQHNKLQEWFNVNFEQLEEFDLTPADLLAAENAYNNGDDTWVQTEEELAEIGA